MAVGLCVCVSMLSAYKGEWEYGDRGNPLHVVDKGIDCFVLLRCNPLGESGFHCEFQCVSHFDITVAQCLF